ncbi:hypothetical protein LJR219_002620 [Phenylobacterium sp. LjRoot219]|uniref:hypothetical protein n=1 Tax=Phenylobacterium sp. LjRoot219 TaxID=3342283 RepID=UPI003ECE5AA2
MLQWPQSVRRLSIALLASGLTLAACERQAKTPPQPAPAAPAPPPVPVATAPRLPTLAPVALGRSELLLALDAASSAYAAGNPDEGEDLAGRRFVIRQAFGCPGAASPDGGAGLARWKWGPRQSSIELSLRPEDWTEAPIVAGDDAHWEAVEGFWLARPWLRAEGCPAVTAGEEIAAPASPQTAGLAAVFEREGSRVGRREGKAFSFTIRGEPPPKPPAAGYRLVLEGRFTAFPGGRAIRCRSEGPDARPLCIAAAEVDRVAFEDADGKLLSEWRPG